MSRIYKVFAIVVIIVSAVIIFNCVNDGYNFVNQIDHSQVIEQIIN